MNSVGETIVDDNVDAKVPYLPLILSLNFRSAYNKQDSFATVIKELGVQVVIGVETWERQKYPLEDLLLNTGFTILSKSRQ